MWGAREKNHLIFIVEKFWRYRVDHILFWATAVGFHVYTRLDLLYQAGFWVFGSEILLRNLLLALIIYAHLEFLIPAFLKERKFAAYALGLLACFGFYIMVKDAHDIYVRSASGQPAVSIHSFSFYNFSIALFYMVFSTALYLSKEWYLQQERLRRMEVEKLNTELDYLRAQINPHFLFNSLNTIYFQIDRTNTEARNTLTKFSDLLRFQLYDCNVLEMPIEREISYLRNYVDLQRLRKDEHYQIDFNVTNSSTSFQIAPLLVIPLIENAFKHLSHRAHETNKVEIELSVTDDLLQVRVWNTTDNRPRESQGGIGLQNLKRRLELQYPDRHNLMIRAAATEFEAQLQLRKK